MAENIEKEKIKILEDSKLRSNLDCPSCGSPIFSIDINPNKSLAKCGSCDHIIQINEDDFFYSRPHRPEIMIPEGVDVLTLSESLDIRIIWRKSNSKTGINFLIFFTLLWNLIIGAFVFSILQSGELKALIGIGLHAFVGIGLLYWITALFINKTDIVISRDNIDILHGPIKLPFKSNTSFKRNELKQFYVTEYVQSTNNGRPNYAYGLYAIHKNGNKVEILRDLDSKTQLYLEQEIERYLYIKDKAVIGSIR